jgi:agmatinase
MAQDPAPPHRHEPRRWNAPFVGIPSFLRAAIATTLEELDADIAVMGVPTDEGSPFMPGSRFAPRAIREHSMRFTRGGAGYYDPEARRELLQHELAEGRLVDVGDADILPTNVAGTFDNVTRMTQSVLERGAMPVVLGGDHAITFPLVRAFREPLHVVHFDAHLDYAPFVHGLEYTNAHAFRHITRLPHVESLTQVGIRSLRNTREMMEDSLRDGNRVVTMEAFRDRSSRALVEQLPANARCYVSLDIDVLDLSLVPGCVSAEPNGMLYAELRDTLFALAEHVEIAGFDLVEVNPQLDVGTGITSYLAAHTIVEFLGRICDQPRWIAEREARAAKRHAARQARPDAAVRASGS